MTGPYLCNFNNMTFGQLLHGELPSAREFGEDVEDVQATMPQFDKLPCNTCGLWHMQMGRL